MNDCYACASGFELMTWRLILRGVSLDLPTGWLYGYLKHPILAGRLVDHALEETP